MRLDDYFTLGSRILIVAAAVIAISACIRSSGDENRAIRWSSRFTVIPLAGEAFVASRAAFMPGPLGDWVRPASNMAIALTFTGLAVLAWSLAAERARKTSDANAYKIGRVRQTAQQIGETVRIGHEQADSRETDRDSA